ncbi:MAG TPA: hypothetical protein VFQ74_09610 [Pseudolysinimonas sp.]|nr:hypothetical protein [Pseudolysinimonas sp.]
MTEHQDLWNEAADASTPLERLAELAYQHPETRAAVASNPASYEGLLEWLGSLGDPAVDVALSARADRSTVSIPPAPITTPGAAAVSPAPSPSFLGAIGRGIMALPLRFRWALGLGTVFVVLLVAIPIAIVQANGRHTPTPAAATHSSTRTADPVPSEAGTSTPTPTPTTPPPPVVPGASWTFANQSGYSYRMSFIVGTPVRYRKNETHPASSTAVYGSACSIDAATDLVIPVTWSATATTSGYKTRIAMRALISKTDIAYTGAGIAPFDGENRVLIEQYFSSGPVCDTESSTNIWGYGHSDGFGVQFTDPIAEGGRAQAAFTIIVKNYFTPATPQGDTALLDWISIRPLFGGDNSDAANVYHDTGATYLGLYSATGISLRGATVTY